MDSEDQNQTIEQASSHGQKQHSNADLMSSAKLVADAARSAMSNDMGNVDKGRVAGAAAELLGAASDYAKLDEKSYGKYVDQAENYLHQYSSSSPASVTDATAQLDKPTSADEPSEGTHSSSAPQSEGGIGDYMKMAQGFLKKY